MAKIILSLHDKTLREIHLTKERVTIGRHPQNDVVIDDLAISGEHAVIVTTTQDSFIEDLNSTNGTQVNGQPVKKHYLRDEDCIELARYRIRYLTEMPMPLHALSHGDFAGRWADARKGIALLKVLDGNKTGAEIVLDRPITTIGQQELHTAVILRRAEGYCLAYVDGNNQPRLNGQVVGADPQKLNDGDLIEISGARVQFLLKN